MPHDQKLAVEFLRGPPRRVTARVLAFCASVSPGQVPSYVSNHPMPGARAHMCFHNVRTACEAGGGAMEYGWLIWEWEDTFLEAEHHALWRVGEERRDVTPHDPNWKKVLFLPDPARTFDFKSRVRVDNRRMALRSDGLVKEYLALAQRYVEIEEQNSVGAEVVLATEECLELGRTVERLRELERELARWSLNRLGRNDSCWCGSGRKYKACCQRAESAF